MCNNLSDKVSKGRFLKPERLQITVTKEKERSERKSEGRKEGKREEKKAMVALLVFIIATFQAFSGNTGLKTS